MSSLDFMSVIQLERERQQLKGQEDPAAEAEPAEAPAAPVAMSFAGVASQMSAAETHQGDGAAETPAGPTGAPEAPPAQTEAPQAAPAAPAVQMTPQASPAASQQAPPAAPANANDEVEFEIQAKHLSAALKEVMEAFKNDGTGIVYVAAVKDDPAFSDNAVAPAAGSGRLVVATMGEGRDYIFVDVPCESIQAEGRFLMNEPAKLEKYASINAKRMIRLRHYTGSTYQHYLELSHADQRITMDVRLPYLASEIGTLFEATQDRFLTPTGAFASNDLQAMLTRAEKVRAAAKADKDAGAARTGDLFWRDDEVEFAAQIGHGEHTLALSLKADFTSPYTFEWEVSPDNLRTLAKTLSMSGSTFRVDASAVDASGDPLPAAFQVAYEKALTGGAQLYAHRQMQIRRDNKSIKEWLSAGETDKDDLFGDANCHLWVSVPGAQVFDAAESVWAIEPSAVIKLERTTRQNQAPSLLMTSGDPTSPNPAYAAAVHGSSAVADLFLHPDIKAMLKALTDGADMFQLHSFPDPDGGGEIPNAMIAVPLAEGEDPALQAEDPDWYLIVTWRP